MFCHALAQQLVQQSNGRATGFPDSGVAARQAERPEVGRPRERVDRGSQELAAPDSAVRSISRPVPGHSEDGALDLVLRHAREDVGVVVLHPLDREAGAFGVAGRQVVGVGVTRHGSGLVLVDALQVADHLVECFERLRCLEIADVLAHEDVAADRNGDCVLEMGAHREHRRGFVLHPHRERSVAARPPDNGLPSQDHARHGVVHMPGDRPIVHQEQVGDAEEPFGGLVLVRADRLV